MTETHKPQFTFITHWKQESESEDTVVSTFWQAEGALSNDVKASERLRQVILRAQSEDGKVAAVCTAVPITMPRLAQPMYYYRCFIGKDFRKTRLVIDILGRAFDVLEEYARANRYPCIGVLLELENSRFNDRLRTPVWPFVPFVYIGKSQRNLDLRIRYFRGARLKKVAKTS
jgi:hypothetical protein